ncbi:TIGR02680 family protein [Paramaledivibacter caminithermalis]|uniref:TIGR02680 family protein n=1 Tax=Paramaledivibacter caminithermalis (strain DSM 15212 / CIP 107654 / DViRD3) TaxID=1121301 RepID=A0A1M6T7B9_PARC5|nr:TIGR02680 family protein [Paramaledivibacter caminithermalis]SHK52891.1 TIGR02680 family protein [Paramaledivibacter caminithermalis DSM 15212]
MNKNRWMMNRAGLLNFWYYDEEEFYFADGKLLLRGTNGSGKSVTMQSFIPLLLDGNKSPERLDPFGSRARKLENYLLGEEEYGKNESTGYIYIEFKKESSGNFLTIGMGLKAKRGRGLEFWGFAITDGRRIGRDIFLYKNIGEKVPLSKTELKNRIGDGGEVKEGQKEYMAMVNKYLFGFDEIEDYDELIKLLIQLRTPKLSKDFRPTVIYEIMNNSLQPLSDDDLRPMSEAIENMDNIKSRLEDFKVSKKAADRLKNAYDQYNRYILFQKTKDYVNSQDALKNLLREEKELREKRDDYERSHKEEEKKLEELEIKKNATEERKRELEKHDSYRIKEKIAQLESSLRELEKENNNKKALLNRKKDKEREIYFKIKELEDKEEIQIKNIMEKLDEMSDIADAFRFHEQEFMKDELLKDIKKEYDFSYVRSQINLYSDRIIKARKVLDEEKAINTKYDNSIRDLENSKKDKLDSEKRVEAAKLLFSETKEEFIEKIYGWEESNKELKPSREGLIEVARRVNTYGEENSFDDIVEEIRKEYNRYEGILNNHKHKLISEKDKYKDKYEEKNEEIKEWINKKDPEPEREKKVILNRERLKNENIPFIPFYMAVDFQEDLNEDEKGILEEALVDMGILDALIIPSKYKEIVLKMDKDMSDRYLFASPKYLMHELSHKLKVDRINVSGINEEDVDNVLKSILLDEQGESTFIDETGRYGIGPIRGKTSSNYKPKYIGLSARKRFKEEMIESLHLEIDEIKEKIDEIEIEINFIEKRLEVLRQEYLAFPEKKDLEAAFSELKEAEFYYGNCLKNVEIKEEEANGIYKQLQEVKQRVYELTFNLEIPGNLEAFVSAEEDSYTYKELLLEFETEHLKLIQLVGTKEIRLRQKEEIDGDIDEINYDLVKIERSIKENTEKRKSLVEQLKISGFEEIENEINNCIKLLIKIPEEIKEAIKLSERAKSNYDQACEKIKDLCKDLDFRKHVTEIFLEAFKEEYQLGYVYTSEIEEEIYKAAKKVYNELKYMEKQDRNKDDYMRNLQEKFHENRQYLAEYNLKMDYTFAKNIEAEDERIKEAVLSQKRMDILGRVRGRYVDFFSLLDYIEEGIEENEKLLRESDRQLFEDILAKNISKKIRAKIYHSEEWVAKMNGLMESMNTSSGLSFSLSWKSKSAETEEQLDTRELVILLRKDGNLLTENELNKLSSHFRSKISEARREAEETGRKQTFHTIMKEVLDYRKWFEFRLYYRKTNENKKELTNNAFYKFSGGEKAMAMYVPLFSAVYAKYEGARKDCPRIISLDEAFAGVDENNIRDMFRLLNELELNFIINSQILWGDYDTVPSLAICELVRPNNANFVTVLRYKWNGKVKELLTNEGVEYGQSEIATTM